MPCLVHYTMPLKFYMQGQCGASYAFAVGAAIEGATALATGKLKNLSVQNIIDCSGKMCNSPSL